MKAKLIKLELHDGYRLDDENGLLIASTLDSCKNKLSLKNCQAIERGYDLDELAIQKYLIENTGTMFMPNKHEVNNVFRQEGFKEGFQKALELMGDKAFNEQDMKFIFACGRNYQITGDTDCNFYNAIQSLKQTEWDVEIEMRSKDIDELRESNEGFLNNSNLYIPELDADACIILKLAKP